MENTAANTPVETKAATTAENPASSQIETSAQPASAAVNTEQNTAPVQQNNAAQTTETAEKPDVTQTQAFSQRLKESTEKAVAEARAKWEQEHSAPSVTVPEVGYTAEEKAALETERDNRFASLIEGGMSEILALDKANREMTAKGDSLLSVKREAAQQAAKVAADLEAERGKNQPLQERNTALEKENAELRAKLDAAASNAAGAAATTGSMASAPTEPDFYSPDEYAALPDEKRKKLVTSGKIFELQKRWRGK